MPILTILFQSIIIGGLVGFAAGVGAARMFTAPKTQALGAFRTLGEMNAAEGDPASHFSFGLGFFFNAWASTVGAGAFTQDITHRVIPNWAAAGLLVKNRNVEQTMHNPKKMGIAGAIAGIVVVGLSAMIMGNAVPGVVLGILVGKGVDELGWTRITKSILVAAILLFVLSGFFRGFDLNLLKSFNLNAPDWLSNIHNTLSGK